MSPLTSWLQRCPLSSGVSLLGLGPRGNKCLGGRKVEERASEGRERSFVAWLGRDAP